MTLLQRIRTAGHRVRPASTVWLPSEYYTWIANATTTGQDKAARWSDSESFYNTNIDNVVQYGQYEPWFGFLRLAQHIGGDATLEQGAIDACAAWRAYPDGNSGVIQGYYNYTDGHRLHWTVNADTDARDTLIEQSANAAYAGGGGGAKASLTKDEELSREVAYAVLGWINAEVHAAQSHNAGMEPFIELILGDVDDEVTYVDTTTLSDGGHIEQWLGDYATDSSGDYVSGSTNFQTTGGSATPNYVQGYAPFMGALTGWTLAWHYEKSASINGGITPDERIITKLVRLFDAQWNEYSLGDGGMKYRWFDGTTGDALTDPAPALNCEIAAIYWWLYKQTGDLRHLQRGDELFNATSEYESLTYTGTSEQVYLSKEYNELLRYTIDGLEWRAEGIEAHQ